MVYLRIYLKNGRDFSIACKKYSFRVNTLDGSFASYSVEGLDYYFAIDLKELVAVLEISKEEYERSI